MTSTFQVKTPDGGVSFDGTPLAYMYSFILGKKRKLEQGDARESEVHSPEATRRLLVRVDAVRAVSWLWTRDVLSTPPRCCLWHKSQRDVDPR